MTSHLPAPERRPMRGARSRAAGSDSAGSATGVIGSRVASASSCGQAARLQTELETVRFRHGASHIDECLSVTGRARHAWMNPSGKSGADAGIPLTRTFFGRAWVAGGSTPAFRVVESGSAPPAPSATDSRPCVATFDDGAGTVTGGAIDVRARQRGQRGEHDAGSLLWDRATQQGRCGSAGSTPAVVFEPPGMVSGTRRVAEPARRGWLVQMCAPCVAGCSGGPRCFSIARRVLWRRSPAAVPTINDRFSRSAPLGSPGLGAGHHIPRARSSRAAPLNAVGERFHSQCSSKHSFTAARGAYSRGRAPVIQ